MDNLPKDFKENDPRDEDFLNEEWLEKKYDTFYMSEDEEKEAIIAELKDKGFIDEAEILESKMRALSDKEELL